MDIEDIAKLIGHVPLQEIHSLVAYGLLGLK